jgi:hypothetical protein
MDSVFITIDAAMRIVAALDALRNQLPRGPYQTMADMSLKVINMHLNVWRVRAIPRHSRECLARRHSERSERKRAIGINVPLRIVCRLYQLTEMKVESTQEFRMTVSAALCACDLRHILQYMSQHIMLIG